MKEFNKSHLLERLPEQFFAKLAKKVGDLKKQGHDVINLGQGNPDLPTPPAIIEELQQAAENPTFHKYSPFRGYGFLKKAVADFYQREYNVSLDSETEVAVLFGAKAGLVEMGPCLLNPGDLALLPDPGYPDYLSGIAMANAETATMPLLEKNHFLPDFDAIGNDTLDKAKLMFLNYPNNPTSATATKDFFDQTVDVAGHHDICVVHDFAYSALGFENEKPPSFLQTEGAKEAGIEIYTMSKTYNMAGWRVAFAVGNPSVVENLNLYQDHMYVSLFGAIQKAAAEALAGDQHSVRELAKVYKSRRDLFIRKANDIGWKAEAPKGTFFAWLPVPESYSSEQFADLLLEKAHVAVAPGSGFGEMGEGYVRVGLLDSEDRLKEAVDRIDKLQLFT